MSRKKVVPSVESLSVSGKSLPCPEKGCTQVFKTSANLNMHVTRHHKGENLKANPTVEIEYHCPAEFCVYNIKKDQCYFTQFKYLKQHFLKVHCKTIECDDCDQRFFSEQQKKAHEKFCGIQFKCYDCDNAYNNYDSLSVHAKRKKHRIKPKNDFAQKPAEAEKLIPQTFLKSGEAKIVAIVTTERSLPPLIYPKLPKTVVKKSQDVGVQIQLTCCKCKCKPIYPNIVKTRSVETQTDCISNNDTILKRAMDEADIINLDQSNKKFKKIKTEFIKTELSTVLNPSVLQNNMAETPSNNLLGFDDFLNSSTQTSPGVNTFYASELEILDNNFVFIGSVQSPSEEFNLMCNNQRTQNSDPSIILDEFNNIETQTAWSNLNDDLFVSTETQTAWPLLNDDILVNTETQTFNEYSHIETQTDFILPFLPDLS